MTPGRADVPGTRPDLAVPPPAGDLRAGARRRLAGAAALGLVLALAYPLLQATGRYSGDQLTTFYVLVVVALLCHLAEWWDAGPDADRGGGADAAGPARHHLDRDGQEVLPRRGTGRPAAGRVRFGWPARGPGERSLGTLPISATDLARGIVLFLTLALLLFGLFELLAGLAGQEATTSGGTRLSPSDQIVGGLLQTVAGGLSLTCFFAGTSWAPGLRNLREDRPISWFAVLVVTQSFATLLAPSSGSQSVAATIANPTTATDLVAGSLPFGVIALLAVGPIVDRTPAQWAERLGLVPLRPAWWLVGIVVGVLLVPTVDWVFTPLQNHLLPSDCVVQQMQVEQSLSGGDTGRGVLANLAVALAAGIDEELVFRGVVLPRFGLVVSSLLFGAFHLQYTCHGLPSVGDLEIVALGFVFGILRIRGGLLAAVLAHAAYDGSILVDQVVPGVGGLAFAGIAVWLIVDAMRRRRLSVATA